MSLRKPHTKSRYGCDWCRKRKVKCDENGPPCDNCILRELDDCTYSRIPPYRRLDLARRAASPAHNAPVEPDAAGPRVLLEVDDLELMHMFSTQTYKSLCVNDSEIDIWQRVVPRLALTHRYLMDGILSLAAIHIATMSDSAKASQYIGTGLQYHNRSLAPFRNAINNISPLNSNAVFAQSVVVVAISIALPQVLSRSGSVVLMDGPGSPGMIETVVTLFELLQGVKKILAAGHSWIDLALFSNGEFWRRDENSPTGGDQLGQDTRTALDALASLDVKQFLDDGKEKNHEVRRRAISHLRHCIAKFSRSPDPAPVLAWLAAIDEVLITGIQRGEPLCQLILVSWAILLKELEGHRWWADNSGRALVSQLVCSLDSKLGRNRKAAEWEACLTWVQHRIES